MSEPLLDDPDDNRCPHTGCIYSKGHPADGKTVFSFHVAYEPKTGRRISWPFAGTRGRARWCASTSVCRVIATAAFGSQSCQRTTAPSFVSEMSTSTAFAPSATARCIDGIVFSTSFAAAPRCPITKSFSTFATRSGERGQLPAAVG